ncbi:MAG: hypothetical protein ACYSTJ_02325 [Planctomycetota bacterium]|jgi:hypothetical protein
MAKNLIISILAVLLASTFTQCVCAAAKEPKPLRDGFALAGVDGNVSNTDDKWLFEFESELSDGRGLVKAGTHVELLASSTLERLAADMEKRPNRSYRLWGRVTKYQGENFIFPVYFLPLAKTEPSQPEQSQESQPAEPELTINEPNDELRIPDEIIGKLSIRKIVRTEQLEKGLELKQDSILADRTATLVKKPDGQSVFVLDGLGRNLPEVSFPLLPCAALEDAQAKQSAEPDPLRFKIAGILTKYQGENYLLLQRAIRLYSHQNFPR